METPKSSSTSAPVDHSAAVKKKAETTTICGESTYKENTGYYEFQWYYGFTKVTKNQNGTTGWATIIHTTNPAVKPRSICRIHLCAQDPCQAWHAASKYGEVGPPIHLQRVPKRTAVAESSGSQLVAESSGSQLSRHNQLEPLAPPEPPPVAPTCTASSCTGTNAGR